MNEVVKQLSLIGIVPVIKIDNAKSDYDEIQELLSDFIPTLLATYPPTYNDIKLVIDLHGAKKERNFVCFF